MQSSSAILEPIIILRHGLHRKHSSTIALTGPTENTCHVIVTRCCVTSPRMRNLRGHKENTAPVLLRDVIAHGEMCLPSRCLETGCITPFYCCVLGRVHCGRCLAMFWANPFQYFIGTKNISKKSFRESETCTVFPYTFLVKCRGFWDSKKYVDVMRGRTRQNCYTVSTNMFLTDVLTFLVCKYRAYMYALQKKTYVVKTAPPTNVIWYLARQFIYRLQYLCCDYRDECLFFVSFVVLRCARNS
jgi:hypothetical protein